MAAVSKVITLKEKDVEKIIKKAVTEGIEAGKKLAKLDVKSIYRTTERKLYAYPDLKEIVEKDKEYLQDLELYGLQKYSCSIIRFKKSGVRLSDEELLEALKQDVRARIASNEYEIKIIEEALQPLVDDPYFLVISGRYFEHISDIEIAERIPCDPSTVRRQRKRLIQRIAVRLFGAEAV